MITYAARHSVIPSRWVVCRYIDGQEVKTDPKAGWYDYGRKTFSVHAGKPEGLQVALAWVKEQFKKEDFVRNRSGDYVEREVNTRFPIPKKEKQP